jgi:hypothetical protein
MTARSKPEPRVSEPVTLDVAILVEALHAQFRLHRPGAKPMSDSFVQAMASYIASEYARLAAEKAKSSKRDR